MSPPPLLRAAKISCSSSSPSGVRIGWSHDNPNSCALFSGGQQVDLWHAPIRYCGHEDKSNEIRNEKTEIWYFKAIISNSVCPLLLGRDLRALPDVSRARIAWRSDNGHSWDREESLYALLDDSLGQGRYAYCVGIRQWRVSLLLEEAGSESEDEIDHTEEDWAPDVIDDTEARKRRKMFVSKYRPMQHIAPTSNVCERLFSRAKLIMRPHRKMMSPYHLDMLFFLRCYKELWNATTVEECLKDPSGAADVAEATA